MADSQIHSKVFSVRIVSIDYYMAPPIPNFDICYSGFQGEKVKEVPVIRIYGSTPAGQKTCLHVHRAFPYLYVPCSDIPLNPNQEGDAYTNAISLAVEKALKLKGNAGSKRQHVHGCSLVRAKKFYGYHSSEELFVKIYLYHPNDVSRVASLLLGGAVFDRSLQPHESHVPFILQFLVDYNMYGMGHVHLSKMKFRHPVPNVFTSRKFDFNGQGRLELDKSICKSADFQADSSVAECVDFPVWIASTVPDDWVWQFSSEFDSPSDQSIHCVKRQSVCELEGDATVDEILNQQFKMYTSLSQTRSDVKMVQSLIPIWEDEYERTGMHEAPVPFDPGRPLPQDVLKTLLHDIEFGRRLTELYSKSEDMLPVTENNVTSLQLVTSSTDEKNLVEPGNIHSNDTNGQALRCSTERDIVGSLSPQVSVCEEDMRAMPSEIKDECLDLLSISKIQSSEIVGTLERKAVDTEALSLLRWLATFQAAEDINSDDELVCETTLSPLLPVASIDKVLEKANTDYESESQKECQDILDSIEDVIDFKGLKEKASGSVDCSRYPQTSLETKVPSSDDLHSSHTVSAENSSEIEIKCECKRYSQHQEWHSTFTSFTNKSKKKRLLWGTLPISMTQKVNDSSETPKSNIADIHAGDSKYCVDKGTIGNENEKCSDALMKNADTDVCESSTLVGCSVRDLMRIKRCRRVGQQDDGYLGVKNVHSEGEKEGVNVLVPKQLDLHTQHVDEHDKKPLGSLIPMPLVTNQQTKFLKAHASKPLCSDWHIGTTVPAASSSDNPLCVRTYPFSVGKGKLELQRPCNSRRQDSAISMGHWETNNGKQLDFGGVTSAEAVTSNVDNSKSDTLSDNCLYKNPTLAGKRLQQMDIVGSSCLPASSIKHEMFATDSYELKCDHDGRNSMEMLCGIPNSLLGMDMSTDTTAMQDENCYSAKQRDDFGFSVLGSTMPKVLNMEGKPVDLIGLTFRKKPPIANWKHGASETALSHPCSLVDEENGDRKSGRPLDEFLPFFERDCQEKKGALPNSDYHVWPEAVMGVPTQYQNDGSLLFLLTPVFSPPSADCVYRWLLHDTRDTSGEINAQSADFSSIKGFSEVQSQSSCLVDDHEALTGSGSAFHLMPILDQVQQDRNRILNEEVCPCHDDNQRTLQTEGNIAKSNACTDSSVDMSQISGPDGRSRPTPLSQIGFRDPASVGAGQQLTLLSVEVHAESRADLRPDPRFDAINVVALAFQNDNDSTLEAYVLLRCDTETSKRSSDGVSGCKVLVFSEEKHLFSHFVMILGSCDPDIIMGWDIQGGSLGFLAERAAHLGMGLLNNISRTPLKTSEGTEETELFDKGILDAVLHKSLIADSVLVEDPVIDDEWGRTHASGVHVGGRVVLNVWRLMRGEVKLNMYSVEAVAEAVLRRKIPSIPHKVLTRWFSSGPGRARYRCIEYVIQRAKLNLEIVNQLDMINRTSELARVFGIDFFSVLSRGSQYRVESMFLRLAHTQNYLAISPGNQQVASQPAMECLPLVMEPESGFYADPVVVLDFQSLYPSMIIAYNLCFCTCLGNVAPSKANILGVSSFAPNLHVLRDLRDEVLLTPNGVMFVPSKVRKGILPRLLEEILSTRIMVKQAMKRLASSQQVLHRIFNARQLALKLIANVTYGYTAAGFSGRMPCAELADSIVQCGRSTLEKAISLVNANDKWKAKVIYGDTDSMFVLLKGRTIKESFRIGQEIASAVTAMNPDPVTLKLEKVYHPCFLLTKKRYVGYSYECADQIEPVFDAKGVETVRRDTCGAVAKIMEQSLRFFFEHQDISKVKAYFQRQWTRILSGRVSLQDFIFAKEVCLGTYSTAASSSLPPAAIVATKAMRADPRAEPRYAERVPYVVIHGEPGARLIDMVVDPLDLLAIDSPYRLNDIYYINKQIIPALQRVFGLIGADLNQWFSETPRPAREAFVKRPIYAPNPQRTRIDYYYLSKHCVLCGELVQASAHTCNKCLQKEIAAATAVIGRTSKLEREMQHLAGICRHCGGGDWLVESGVKCTSLACSVFFERRKVQKELQVLSAVAVDKGFYPKCMVEWF